MTIQRTSVFLATLLMLGLSGCNMFGNKPESSPATTRAALEIPPDLARPAGDDLAAVPPGGTAAYSDYTAKTPAAASIAVISLRLCALSHSPCRAALPIWVKRPNSERRVVTK